MARAKGLSFPPVLLGSMILRQRRRHQFKLAVALARDARQGRSSALIAESGWSRATRPTNFGVRLRDFLKFVRRTSKWSRSQRFPLLSEAKARALSAAFFGLVLLTMAGWACPLGSIFLKFGAWCVCYFAQ
jgi:hypothetical protein